MIIFIHAHNFHDENAGETMLTQVRNDNQKTVMGILSLLPGLRELAHLNAEIAWYNDRDTRLLYIWQSDSRVQAVLGVELLPACSLNTRVANSYKLFCDVIGISKSKSNGICYGDVG